MPIDFPSSPTLNQTYTFGSRTWQWDGSAWVSVGSGGSGGASLNPGWVVGQVVTVGTGGTLQATDFTHASSHSPSGTDRVITMAGHDSPNRLETFPRILMNTAGMTALTSQEARFYHVTSNINKTVNRIRTFTGTTVLVAGSGGPLQVRLGLYTVASNGDLTLVARTAVQTPSVGGFWGTINTAYETAFDTTGGYPASYDLIHGQRYAVGFLWNTNGATGATVPTILGMATSGPTAGLRDTIMNYSPRTVGIVTGQTDLPTTVANASLVNSNVIHLAMLFNSADSGV